jgi:hypothetical protein
VRLVGILSIAVAAAIATATNAAEESCDRYAGLKRPPPDQFEEIAIADFGVAELFVLSDGKCTCDNRPAVARALGKPAPENINWSCRVATSDERRND